MEGKSAFTIARLPDGKALLLDKGRRVISEGTHAEMVLEAYELDTELNQLREAQDAPSIQENA